MIDDGSKDRGIDLVNLLAQKDSRIRIFSQANVGASAARNVGLSQARGEYVFFLDADDFLEPFALESYQAKLVDKNVELVVGNFRKISGRYFTTSGNEKYFDDDQMLSRDAIYKYALLYAKTPYVYVMLVHCWGKLYLKSIIEERSLRFNTDLQFFEDVDFNFRYLLSVKSLVYIHTPQLNYSMSGNLSSQSFSADNSRQYVQFITAFQSVGAFLSTSHAVKNPTQIVSHLFSSSVIMMLLRICARTGLPQGKVQSLMNELVHQKVIQTHLRDYRPGGKDSRVIPFLIKLKLSRLLVLYCRIKYRLHRLRASV